MVRTMTRAQYEAEFGMKPVSSGVSKLDTTVAPRIMTRAEYEQEFPSAKQITQKDLSATKGLSSYTNKVNEAQTAGKEKMSQATKSWTTNLRAPLDLAVGATEYITSPIAPLFEPLGKAIDFVGNKISDSPNVQKFAGTKAGQVTADLAQVLQDAAMVTGTVGIVGDPLILRPKARPSYVGKTTLEVPKTPPPPPKAVAKVAQEIYNIENNYQKLRNANDYAKDAGAASRLRIADTGVLERSVDTDGVIRTKQPGGAADIYRKQTIDGVEGVVRDLVGKEKTKVNLAEVKRDLVTEVYKSGLEGADLVTALKGVQKEIAGLGLRADEFGNILLEKLHDAKISTTRNIDFNTPAETKTYRKAVARAYKTLVENKSTTEVKIGDKAYRVADINKELSKYYQDIERIQSLDGRRVKGGRFGKYTAQISGNIVGGVAGAALGPLGMLVGPVLGGEAAGFLKGRAMSKTFGRSRGFVATENPILAKARAEAGLPPIKDLSIPDTKIGVPKGIPKTKEVISLEKQIERNVEAQKVAIKAKDFTLVSALKEIYANLVAKLKEVIQRIKATPGKEGGFVKVGDYSNNLGKRNTQYSKTSTNPSTNIKDTIPQTPKKSIAPVDNAVAVARDGKKAVTEKLLTPSKDTYKVLGDNKWDGLDAPTGVNHVSVEGIPIEEPMARAVDVLNKEIKVGENMNSVSSGFMNGLGARWGIVFNENKFTPAMAKAAKDAGLTIEKRRDLVDVMLDKVKASEPAKATEVFNRFADKYQSELTKSVDPLTLEARKYKSAEEFVKAKGGTVYHGTSANFDSKNIKTKFQLTDIWNKVHKKK